MSFKIYMKIDGLMPPGTENPAIECFSFSWGASNTSSNSGTGGGAGKVVLSDLSVMKRTDATTPLLFKACATGKHFAKVELACVTENADGNEDIPYKLTLGNALVSSIQHSGSEGGDDRPTESLSLHYMKIDIFAK